MRISFKMFVFLAACVAVLAQPAAAQTGTPTAYVFRVIQGAATVSEVSVPAASVSCNQPRVNGPAPPTMNPTEWRFADPADASRDCVYQDTARLQGLTDGSYGGVIFGTNADGAGAQAAAIPFVRRRPNPPAALGNQRLI